MPSLISIKQGPGLILDWSQAASTFAIGGDSRDIVIWDASSKTKVDASILRVDISQILLMSLPTIIDNCDSIKQAPDGISV